MTDLVKLDYPKARVLLRVSSDDERAFRANACAKEPWTVAFIEGMPDDGVFMDLGANVGSYTLLAAALGRRVVACEPGYANYAALCENIKTNNQFGAVIALPIAIGSVNGLSWFHYSDTLPGAANHTLGQPLQGDKPLNFHRQAVIVFRVDDMVTMLGLPAPTHIKLDIDGGELAALQGAERTLKSGAVQGVMLEMKNGQEEALAIFMGSCGFKVAGHYTERNGQKIGGVSYGHFVKEAG